MEKKPPHPATMVQRQEPHPATVAQPKAPHPAAILPRKPPHPATVVQRRTGPPGPAATYPLHATPGVRRASQPQAIVQMMSYDEVRTGRYYAVKHEGFNTILFLRQKSKLQGLSFTFQGDSKSCTQPIVIKGEVITSEVSQEERNTALESVAKLHLGEIAGIYDDFNDSTARMLRGIPGGGAFTCKRNSKGDLRVEDEIIDEQNIAPLTSQQIEELSENTALFNKFASGLGDLVSELDYRVFFPLYRGIRVANKDSLKKGDKIRDILPSSCSFSADFVGNWGNGVGKVALRITVPTDYPVVMFSYPFGRPIGKCPQPRNQEQLEVIIAPTEYTIDALSYVEGALLLHVTPRPLEDNELKVLFEQAKKTRVDAEEELERSNKKREFTIGEQVFFVAEGDEGCLSDYFSVNQIERIKSLKKNQEVKSDDGNTWRMVDEAYDDKFDSCTLERVG